MIPLEKWLRPWWGSMQMIFFLMDSCANIKDSCIVIWLSYLSGMTIIFQICTCMLSYKFSNDWLQSPTSTCKSFHPTLVRPLHFMGHLLHNILSLSLYSPFHDPRGTLQWPSCVFTSWRNSHYVPLHEKNISLLHHFPKIFFLPQFTRPPLMTSSSPLPIWKF